MGINRGVLKIFHNLCEEISNYQDQVKLHQDCYQHQVKLHQNEYKIRNSWLLRQFNYLNKIQCGWFVITDNKYHNKKSSGSLCLYPEISNGDLFQFDHFASYNFEFIRGRETKTGKWILIAKNYEEKDLVKKVNPIRYEMLLTMSVLSNTKTLKLFIQ